MTERMTGQRPGGWARLLLHPTTVTVAVLAVAAGAAAAPAGPVAAALLVAVAGAVAGFANSGST